MNGASITLTVLRAIGRDASPPSFAAATLNTLRADLVSGGAFRVRGTVKVSGTPAQRRVVLFDSATGPRPLQRIRSTWSAADDGSYSFERIADSEYIVIAFDYARDKNAAIADFVRPEPMP
jgi:hypothetical protein